MTDRKRWEGEYDQNVLLDCPHCEQDRPNHSCRNCYSEMDKETCWKNKGYCNEKCLKYIIEDLPKMREQKQKKGIKCQCDDPRCAKCLGMNCKDRNCPTHTRDLKAEWRQRWERAHGEKFPRPVNY